MNDLIIGIVGMGGAGFPTHVKLSPKNEADIDTIIVNGAECEPYITSDYRRMIEEPMKLILGLQIVVNLFNRARGIIAVEDNKPEAIKILKEMTKDLPNITVRQLKTKYPQGAERQLIYASTGRFVNSKMLPADAGVIVNNVDTIISIYEAVIEGRPLISRVVTVSGDAIAEPGNFIVPLGTSYRELIEAAGGPTNLAYIKGARLERIANDAEKTRMKAIYKMQQELLQQQLMEYAISSQKSDNIQQVSEKATEAQLEKFEVPNTFSVGIELDKAIAHPESDANIVLRAGDKLIIPQYTATVKINGAVMYPNAIAYAKGKKAKYYINAAGGYAQNARKKGAYVIYMNGMVSELDQNTEIAPGCEIVVPSKISRKMSVAETMGIGTGIASIATMIATIANLAK